MMTVMKFFLSKPILPTGALVLILGLVLFLGNQNLQNKIRGASAATTNNPQIQQKSLNVYDKMRMGKFINYLVVGDGTGQGDGTVSKQDKWFYQFEQAMKTSHQVTALRTLVTHPAGTVFGGWYDYGEMLRANATYDLVILSFGYHDQAALLDSQTYGEIHESLIRSIKTRNENAEILLIIEPALQTSDYPEVLQQLSTYYDLPLIDIRTNDPAAVGLILSNDGILPSRLGYERFNQAIMQTLEANMNQNKTMTAIPSSLLYPGSRQFGTGTAAPVSSMIANSEGFIKDGDRFSGKQPGNFISGYFKGSLLGLIMETNKDGGIAKVYIDGKFAATIDTYSKTSLIKKMLITSSLAPQTHAVKLVISGNKKKESTGNSVRLIGFITATNDD
ncbi:SGNH/GDSL hydrolase family protein [Paenibacillus nasutitermitis]|uniref:Uncharacterized protein n=1 Tax=Paenibacillus nasutitermitis TaxID=1652958 RepID=A0A916YY86_9BACL|nr:SGNH/GDSL hydrolase family protein [Paenibacillus nasutitermitis]GGD66997.1 hypothetical protein GCM10010911_25960 [Paenibacillus nasutitermitis]